QIASNGTLDLNGNNNVLASLILEVGPLGGSTVNLGGGTLALQGNVTVHSLGAGNPSGATINGGTLGLNAFNATAAPRTYTVNNGAAGSDLVISSAVVDGSVNPSGLTKAGFGELELQGTTPNTFTGTTTVSEGTLLLNKTAGVLALSGPLTVGD